MPSWWNSLDSVTAFNAALRWLAATMAVIGAFVGLAIFLSGRQVDVLLAKTAAPRIMTPEQETAFLNQLNRDSGGKIVAVQYDHVGGKEARAFAAQLARLLKGKEWLVISSPDESGILDEPDEPAVTGLKDIPEGITMVFPNECISPEYRSVSDALNAAGFIHNWRIKTETEPGPLVLVIGARPH